MLLCVFLSKVTLDKKSGNGIWTAILAVRTTELVSSGMVNRQKDQTLCDKILSSHVIAANVFFA
jgi:hypothetical protein